MICSMWSTRRARHALVLLVLLSSITPARAQEALSWRAAVGALLADRAAAVETGDRRAFAATQPFAPASFKKERLAWFDRLQTLPLSSYRLSLDDETYEDLVAGTSSAFDADERHVVVARERIKFGRFDSHPSDEAAYLTVVRRGSQWSIVGDSSVGGLGLSSVRNIWDMGPVKTVTSGSTMVITRGSIATARAIASEATAATARVKAKWPLPWDGRVVLVIPADTKELARVLQTSFDLGPFVAFASASVDRTDGGWDLVGSRVYVQPATYFTTGAAFQADTLGHELLHVATRKNSGGYVPSWLEEGVAQIFGERAPPPIPEFARRVRSGSWDGRVPTDVEFGSRANSDIKFSYQSSADFVRFLRAEYGSKAVGRFYARLGAASPASVGTRAFHLNVASRSAFARSFGAVEKAWAMDVRRRFA